MRVLYFKESQNLPKYSLIYVNGVEISKSMLCISSRKGPNEIDYEFGSMNVRSKL